ncbi:glycosyltransferase family 4 protein [uncultured Polaribacter sp.]|uniref:glycosyltransferase family 4 protein n=1 Tax=uncultured Polaribacter sp. TaxID=174711 RepID=UPI0026146668|nr:glycosyltransferase family 4 protein [uncultured Polaribacter sp.]
MKILIVNTFDTNGGAARAAFRLHEALLSQGVNSTMLVTHKEGDNFRVIQQFSRLGKVFNQIQLLLTNILINRYKKRSKSLFSSSWIPFSNFSSVINRLDPDIVHLHWISGGMLNFSELLKIKAPIVWSLHDMWSFTGGCHYDKNCGNYLKECGYCPILGSNTENDLSSKIFKHKKRILSKVTNLTIVGLSNWLKDCAEKSSLLKDSTVVNLPNPINTNLYRPLGREHSRNLWSLPKDKKLVLFGAVGAMSDSRKGFKQLSEALKVLPDKNIEFVIFGSSKPEYDDVFDIKTHYAGVLKDDMSLVTLYNAVDVMVVPSLQENLSNAIMESLSCGTPVVGFDIGGNKDMILHKVNGYLAKPFNKQDLANGISWVLNSSNYEEIRCNSRKKVLNEFSNDVVGKKYIKLYEDIIK